MSVILSHISAIEYQRAYRFEGWGFAASAVQPLSRYMAHKVLATRPAANEALGVLDIFPGVLNEPVHLVVLDAAKRRQERGVVYHIWSKYAPVSSIRGVSRNVFCCDVALALAQCCGILSRGQIAQLVMELCGRYKADGGQSGFSGAPPATDVAAIRRFTERYPSVPGCAQLGRIVRYLADNSASPMETVLTILLAFPVGWGGYGLIPPQLNERIDIPSDLQRSAGRSCYFGDLVWPTAKLVVEYDSDSFHVGHERIASDAQRRNILSHLGYNVITVTSDQVYSASKMDSVARQICHKLGKRIRPTKGNYADERFRLRQTLLFGSDFTYR